MTTTSFLQKKPDYYISKEECIKDVKTKIQTNLRYKGFNQRQFTAGDEDQFQTYRDATNGQICIPEINTDDNIYNDLKLDPWSGYKNLEAPDVLNTFRYIFNKFKKGIFAKIKDGKLAVFLPFSKASFTNEWGDKILVDPTKYKSTDDFLRHISKMQGYKFFPERVFQDTSKWYGNNCLVRYENPISEGDSNVSNVKNMLEELCEHRDIPDIEFFINRRDFPLLKKDGTEPYDGVWNSENKPLVSHHYKKYVPIFSMSKTDKYADVLNPTWDDWARVQKHIWFPNTCGDSDYNFDTPWSEKKDIAVFRGGSTGCGTTTDSNMRLKIAEISMDNKQYLDAGITNWNLRPRKNRENKYIQTIEPDTLKFKLVPRMSPGQQSRHKYIVHIQGHVSAFRLSLELSMGSVILYVKNQWKIWYTDMLVPYKHYVPVKEDLSDLIDRIKWCREHDKECREIAKNALEFYDTYLQKDGILDYMQKTIIDLKNTIGVYLYNSQTPVNAMITTIESQPRQQTHHNFPIVNDFSIQRIPNMGRSFGLLQGVEWLVEFLGSNFIKAAKDEGSIFQNKLSDIHKYTLAGFPFVVKFSSDTQKKLENVHEGYIGINSINLLSKEIPNFAYIFGEYDGNVILEHIKGESMADFLKYDKFNMYDFTLIFAQICLALEVAQKRCGFVHWDLKPWNIMIQRFDRPKVFDYAVDVDKIYRVKTNIVPVIIDYGKSHVIYNNTHHGFINPYRFSSVQDILTLLLTSVNQIVTEKRLSKDEFSNLMNISNFVSGTKYRRNNFRTAKDLREFTHESKKYTNLISADLYDLENKGCLDMLAHIMKTVSIPITKTENYINSMGKGNAQQVFEYIFSPDTKSRLKTYENVFVKLMHSTIPQPKCKFFMYYAAQTIETNVKSVWSSFKKFLEKENISVSYYEKMYDNIIDFLKDIYIDKIKYMKPIKLVYDKHIVKDIGKYDETIFLTPENVKEKLVEYKDVKMIKDIIPVFLYKGMFEMTVEDREFYLDNLSDYMNYNMVQIADAKTLSVVSGMLYETDLGLLQDRLKYESGDCKETKKIISLYTDIIEYKKYLVKNKNV